ncbi:Dipeptidyl aminopeptidase/acylaminoacyl peptidase [Friedmanniella luteola]|uniref:Dipeptidyl aminopeptidase/acylaminoacyl peptidase n=1 Tax=Friedmanniella luteola TaxID=546871 RepID=A0A1H1SIS0_9ACTN|nr:alpha/beta fold hydrolase [Friedmanniella luteola]SDS47842.1 Dipeptidyl aminopeptidase/acylaminoacyl peptidase [Friedmanniella luteola]
MASPTLPSPTPGAVTALVGALLDLRTWQAFDVDADGRVLAGHDERGSVQLVEIDPDGTRTALTDLPSRCTGRYVPGRRQVVVQHDQGGDENMQLSLLDLATRPTTPRTLEQLTPLVADPAFMHVLRDVTPEHLVYSTNRRNAVDMDVVVRSWDTGQEETVWDGGGYVADTVVAHDGRSVAVTALSLQPASTLVFLAGPRAVGDGQVTDPDEHAAHHCGGWTADDEGLVLSSNHGREFSAVVRVALDGSTWSTLVADDEHDLEVRPSPDGTALVVGRLVDGATELAVHEADGTLRCPVLLEQRGVADVVWATDSSRFVLTFSSPTVPGSLLTVDAATGAVSTVVDGREGVPAELAAGLVEPTAHRVPTPDGERVPCFVYTPRAAAPALAGAAVVLVHGGPEGASTLLFSPVVQALVGSGFTVLVPNVRGSVGYGKRWYSLDDVDLRLDSVADLAALHAWLPALGLDPARAALWGGSYGGYMVLAGTTMQPDLWAAGVDIVGISSLVTFLENTSGYRRAYREREYGSLAHDRELLVRASPLTYLDQLRAPLFVIHGANDPRVPLSEAEQIVEALAARGIPHELKVYADEGHGLAKRANRKDAYPAAIGFLVARLGR